MVEPVKGCRRGTGWGALQARLARACITGDVHWGREKRRGAGLTRVAPKRLKRGGWAVRLSVGLVVGCRGGALRLAPALLDASPDFQCLDGREQAFRPAGPAAAPACPGSPQSWASGCGRRSGRPQPGTAHIKGKGRKEGGHRHVRSIQRQPEWVKLGTWAAAWPLAVALRACGAAGSLRFERTLPPLPHRQPRRAAGRHLQALLGDGAGVQDLCGVLLRPSAMASQHLRREGSQQPVRRAANPCSWAGSYAIAWWRLHSTVFP